MANVACALAQSRVDSANSLCIGMPSFKLTTCSWCKTRVMTLFRKRDHIQPSLKKLHWLPTRQRVDFMFALLTYSIRHFGEPQHRNSLLMYYKPSRSLRTAEGHLLVVSGTKPSSTFRAFIIVASNPSNTLLLDIRLLALKQCQYLENC